MKLIHVWIILMLLTAITIVTTFLFHSPSLIIGLFSIKFLLVAFQFMELKKAHNFWKVAIIGIVLVIDGLLVFV